MAKLVKKNGELVLKDYHLSQANDMYLDCDAQNSLEVSVKLVDKRLITEKQRKFIFALCGEIAYHTGDDKEWVRMLLQTYNAKLREIEVESLSSCDMTYANGLIDTIITFAIDQEIPFSKKLIDDYEYKFNEKQVYSMCLKRTCVICGGRADLHHVNHVGMGNNRKKISHVGKKILPLCRQHHNEIHNMGEERFIELNHLTPVTIDSKLEYFINKGKIMVHKGDM